MPDGAVLSGRVYDGSDELPVTGIWQEDSRAVLHGL
jgi:hypothetical protein